VARSGAGSRPRRRISYHVVCGLIDLSLYAVTRRWHGPARLPAEGPLLVAPNHVSILDPVVIACAVLRRGRIPRFVTTAEVFDTRVVGPVLRYFDHIPLDRRTRGDADRLRPIEEALRAGECVVLYPEGRLTTDPDLRPVRGQPGIALVAARTGAPIVPVGHWGSHRVRRPGLRWPQGRAHVSIAFGEPVTVGPALDARRAVRATAEVMRRVTAIVYRLRESDTVS
jgi:1-acyl-sn-glycerol-3-phosphate acyltransferase